MCVNIKNGAIGKNFNKEKERDPSPKKNKDLDERVKELNVKIKNGANGKNINKEKERDPSPNKKKDLDERVKELEKLDKKKDKEEISSLCYWQGEAKLITASWDGLVRIFDDGEATEEG